MHILCCEMLKWAESASLCLQECPRVIVACHAFTRVIGEYEADVHLVMLNKADQQFCTLLWNL